MYIPKHFANTDQAEVTAFMQKYSFGTIVTSADNMPVATHLPFIVEERDGEVYILSHFAKANPQAKELGNNILVIFTEPHAYISPKHYEKEQSVPTWNYIAVHAYGKATILSEQAEQLALMEKSILYYDAAYLEQWKGLSDEFKFRMLNGIVAFEIKVADLQAVNKLSQNKTELERASIINSLEKSADSNEVTLAKYMKKVTK
jgi:transcriptional regulator